MPETSEQRSFSFDDFVLDVRRRRLTSKGGDVNLNARAFELLIFLVENAGRVVTKEEILAHVWKDQFVEESNLAVQISSLRKALGESPGRPRLLATVPGRGYQFTGFVEPRINDDGVNDRLSSMPAADPARSQRSQRFVWIVVCGLFALAVISGLAYLLKGGFGMFGPEQQKQVGSIAVLPFVNEAPDDVSPFVADGIAEGLILSLSKLPNMRVISRESSFRFKDEKQDAAAFARRLRVQAVVTGRIARIEEAIYVRVEVASTSDNSVLWGDRFVFTRERINDVHITIARAIARSLGISLGSQLDGRLDTNATNNLEAYQLYLAGRYHLKRFTDDGFEKGRINFKQAVELDPGFALAYVGLADSYNMLCGWGAMRPNEGYPLAKASALRALELDESLAGAHTALGAAKLFYDIDWTGAESDFKRAIELDLSSSEAHFMYGYELMLLGRFAEAGKHLELAMQLDPLSIDKVVSLGNIHFFGRDNSRAMEVYGRAVDMDPNSGVARWAYANALLQLNRHDEAIAEYKKAIELSGNSPDEPASLAFAYAVSGRANEARQVLNQLAERGGKRYVPASLLASVYGALGENDRAFELMEQAFRERDPLIVYLKVEPIFDPLRTDPRFDELLRRAGLD